MKKEYIFVCLLCIIVSADVRSQRPMPGQSVHRDTAFNQRFAIRYLPDVKPEGIRFLSVHADRNGVVQVLSSAGILKPVGGQLLYPGTLVNDKLYRPLTDRHIAAMTTVGDQFIYADDQQVLSNAWAGKPLVSHGLHDVRVLAAAGPYDFLLSDGKALVQIQHNSVSWSGQVSEPVISMLFDSRQRVYLLLSANEVSLFDPQTHSLTTLIKAEGLTAIALDDARRQVVVGTRDGYFVADATTGKRVGEIIRNVPSPHITTIKNIAGKLWFGSDKGAFATAGNGQFNYFASQRWMPSDNVIDIAAGQDGTVLILTDKGLSEIRSEKMTLAAKAAFFEKQVRDRHIRNGFNATISRMTNGDPSTGTLEDSDNDGLWTSMYLGGEVFRYAATHSPDALQNVRESLAAMERLYTINPVKGFPARSFERTGYELADKNVWRHSADSGWDWKSTTSSDEVIGHVFVFGAIAELIADTAIKNKAIHLLDELMQHIVDHDMYLVDWNGEPTRWGRWNPGYVNARPEMVGDRKITSSNIIAMLQTAYHFTHKKVFREKALDLMQNHSFLTNLMRPMSQIANAPDTADELSKMLSEGWNHSDDEMYFLGYWGLYRYALSDTLKTKFKAAILDHWEAERPEKEAAWNIFTAITGVKNFDLAESINYLQRYPLDLIEWKVINSDRKDIEPMPENFRRQSIKNVLPPDEMPIHRHNANLFQIDGGNGGQSENSAGDIWLLPYWMGRYLGIISASK